MKYVITSALSDLAVDVLLNATDYIGNRPECYNAGNHDLGLIRHNDDFRSMVNGYLMEEAPDWDTNSQEMCADFVWDLYLQWADGLC